VPNLDLQGPSAPVGEFVKGNPVTTDYVLYAGINARREAVRISTGHVAESPYQLGF
jgi:hypothetical protein